MGIVTGVQNVSITIAAGATSGTATITAVDPTLSVVRYAGSRGANTVYNPANGEGSVVLTDGTTVTAARNSSDASNSLIINASVISFSVAAIKSIQVGIVTIGTGATSATATITSVTTTNAALFYNGSQDTNTSVVFVSPNIALTNGTTVTATTQATGQTHKAYFTVVEFNSGILNSSTQSGSISMAATDLTKTATITSVTAANSMLLYGGAVMGSNTGNADFWPRMTLTNATTVTASRNSDTSDTATLKFMVVEFKSADVKSTNRGDITIASSGASNTATITSVSTTLTAIEFQGQTAGGSGVAETEAASCATVALTNATTVTVARVGTPAKTLIVSYEAIEFKAVITAPCPYYYDQVGGM